MIGQVPGKFTYSDISNFKGGALKKQKDNIVHETNKGGRRTVDYIRTEGGEAAQKL